jgi:hypothetical protein
MRGFLASARYVSKGKVTRGAKRGNENKIETTEALTEVVPKS